MSMPTTPTEAMQTDSLGKQLGGNAVFVGFDIHTNGWAVFGTLSNYTYSTHKNNRKAAEDARDELQKNA